MTRKKINKYIPEVCECCGQDTTYQLQLNKGTALLVWKIAKFIRQKGINAVHPRKEMEGKILTSNDVGNLSTPRFHGLIARIDGESGNYLLTPKGASFLRNEPVAKIAIVRKAKKNSPATNIGYHLPDEVKTTFRELVKDNEYWTGIDYTIHQGRVIVDTQQEMF